MAPGSPWSRTAVGRPVFQVYVRPERDETRAGTVTVRCTGELDMATASMLTACVARQCATGRRTVRLDLSGLQFCDARGLAALLEAHRHVDTVGGQLVLVNPSATLRRSLKLTGLDEVLQVMGEVIPFQRRRPARRPN